MKTDNETCKIKFVQWQEPILKQMHFNAMALLLRSWKHIKEYIEQSEYKDDLYLFIPKIIRLNAFRIGRHQPLTSISYPILAENKNETVTITGLRSYNSPSKFISILAHEMMHVRQNRKKINYETIKKNTGEDVLRAMNSKGEREAYNFESNIKKATSKELQLKRQEYDFILKPLVLLEECFLRIPTVEIYAIPKDNKLDILFRLLILS